MAFRNVSLDDKYTLREGRIFITGIQALVRLPMIQRELDQAAGHDTAGYVSGYRGSPLGSLDQQMVRARAQLTEKHVVFSPGVNEDLAATAIWGTQQGPMTGECRYDGVFGMWYAKGPGVDRSGDVLRHANLAGTSSLGGALALMGDDHACESSTTAHQTEYAMKDAMIPVLNPAGVQDVLDFGLYGWALSRYSGCWVGLKCVHDTIEATASVAATTDHINFVLPGDADFSMPDAGLNIRWPDTPQEQEQRLHEYKLEAVKAFWRLQGLDRVVFDSPRPWLGIATTGKSYLDTRQALNMLGIDEQGASRLGIRLYKLGMTWPMEPNAAQSFAKGLESIIVVEEKRGLIEEQFKSLLYGQSQAPRMIGKYDENGQILFQSWLRLNGVHIAIELGKRIAEKTNDDMVIAKLRELQAILASDVESEAPAMQRTPYFCAGCPHNTSTRVPEGSKALAGIGCHFMSQWMDRDTDRYTQMGGEGASWVGEARFSKRTHMFQNIGDGTYYHSGYLAVRASVAAGTNVTFKILFNDAVAMTGGQPMDGPLTVPAITQQLYGEGVRRIVVVTDEPEKYDDVDTLAKGVTVHHRRDLDLVQRELRDIEGTTGLVYDQTCASEKRRRRKRGAFPDPDKWAFINEEVCEGCGDCGIKSNCVAILPKDTQLGRKRAIDQSACNKDYSCVTGFCPSFVTVHGGRRRTGVPASGSLSADKNHPGNANDTQSVDWISKLPEPALAPIDDTHSIILTGVGGTGVVTIGAIIGMAAHIADKGISILDMIGLAQKGGAVTSHIILAEQPDAISSTHIAAGDADLILGGDIVTTAADSSLVTVNSSHTCAVVNTYQMMTGEFTLDRDKKFPINSLRKRIESQVGPDYSHFFNATELSRNLLGNTIGANLLITGYAWQKGLIPLPAEAIEQAIRLNGQAVEMNLEAFHWGRRLLIEPEVVKKAAQAATAVQVAAPESTHKQTQPDWLPDVIDDRANRLVNYQDQRYADRYRNFVTKVETAEKKLAPGMQGLSRAVAENYYKLLAYKDEYEVARLHSSSEFKQAIEAEFEGDYELRFHLAPPLLSRRDPVTGHLRKREFGPWIMKAFDWLSKRKGLRGTRFDIFGYTAERRAERQLIIDYEASVDRILQSLTVERHGAAVAIAQTPQDIRGFGHVKESAMREAADSAAAMWEEYENPSVREAVA